MVARRLPSLSNIPTMAGTSRGLRRLGKIDHAVTTPSSIPRRYVRLASVQLPVAVQIAEEEHVKLRTFMLGRRRRQKKVNDGAHGRPCFRLQERTKLLDNVLSRYCRQCLRSCWREADDRDGVASNKRRPGDARTRLLGPKGHS